MDNGLSNFCDIEFIGGSSDVTLAKPISTHDSVQSADHHIVSYIEFSVLVEKRFFNILLDDVSLLSSVRVLLFFLDNVVQLVYLVDYCDSLSSIGKFSRLYNPNILGPTFA